MKTKILEAYEALQFERASKGQQKQTGLSLDSVRNKIEELNLNADLDLDSLRYLKSSVPTPLRDDDDRAWQYTIGEGNQKVREAITKNINYWPVTQEVFATKPGSSNIGTMKFLQMVQNVMGYSAIIEILNKLFHVRYGSQMVVEENVTRDLALTDLSNVGIEDIPFPCDSLEFYFEDPKLPTVLVYRGTLSRQASRLHLPLREWAQNSANEYDEDSINFWIEGNSGAGMAFRASSKNWNQMLSASNEEIGALQGSVAFEDDEWDQIKPIFKLCLNVLAYASIPRLAPKLVSKSQLKHGGKPKVRNRPQLPILKVIYLPEIKKERSKESEPSGRTHNFYGRRGVLRYYKDDRYVNMKGKYQYIPPILGPNGEIPKALFKVRKPK